MNISSSHNPYEPSGMGSPDLIGIGPRSSRSLVLAITAIVVSGLSAIAMFRIQRVSVELFSEFGIEVSSVHSFLMSLRIPSLLAIASVGAIVVSVVPRFHPIANRWNGLVIMFAIMMWAVFGWGIFIPYSELINGISD